MFQRAAVSLGRQVAFIGMDSADPTRAEASAFLRTFPQSYPSFYDPSGKLGVAITDSSFTPVTVFYDRRGGRYIHQGPYLSMAKLEADIRRYALDGLSDARACASTRSAATGRSSPASARNARRQPTCAPPEPIDAGATRSRRATRTGRRRSSTRCAPAAGRRDSPGWTVRVVPNLYPALDPPRCGGAGGAGIGQKRSARPARRQPELFAPCRRPARTR